MPCAACPCLHGEPNSAFCFACGITEHVCNEVNCVQVMCGQPPVPIKSERLTYNGHTQQEFNVRRTARYVDQNDLHNANLTVRETLRFSALCQGPGYNQSALFWRLLVSLRTLGGQLLLATQTGADLCTAST
jgi:hypothetical protein